MAYEEHVVPLSDARPAASLAAVARERDLYLRLLRLGGEVDLEAFLRDALALLVEVVDARQGYVELVDPADGGERWSMAHGFSPAELESVRAAISRGIIAQAIATGETVLTQSASEDPRFSGLASVRLARIDAVLCAPIGQAPPLGILYLQGRRHGGLLTEQDRTHTELVATHLAPLVRSLLERRRADGDDPTAALRAELRLDAVVGRSPALAAALHQVALVAPLDVTVLLTGETGTGKSQLARVIHDNGPRAGGPFVELNCAAVPETLVESELFGARRGAHSTATSATPGKVAAAEGGTLFLDEIGELGLQAQAKLLQLLQSKQYYPLGSTHPETANVRVIAATNTDLAVAIAERRFREDLFYRLQVIPLRVPSLAERATDTALLARHLARGACERHGLPLLALSPATVGAVEVAEWPGNVRQLAHALEAAVIRAAGDGARQVEAWHVFPDATAHSSEPPSFQEQTRRFQACLLEATLEECGWNVGEAARRLDLARSYAYKLIRAFGIERRRR
jgi:Nif-specific regulatory protein